MKKSEHFLEEIVEKHQQKTVVDTVKNSVSNISEERIKIGKSIQELIKKGYSKKEVLDVISSKTFLSIQAISSMIDEFTFNNDFDLNFVLTSNQIKIIKKIFKENKFTYIEQTKFLKQDNLEEILTQEYDKILKDRKKRYVHTISFDEDGEVLFRSLKESLEKQLDKKINNSELVFYALMELYNSNPDELNENLFDKCDI
jgi:hypothetical protein